MKIVGLTGGIASGKSTVSQMLMDEGLTVLDADIFAREVVKPGSFGLRALYQAFGPEVMEGENLNRTFLGEKLFADDDCRATVERITHPLIQWRASQEFRWLENHGAKAVVYDAALIFEKNLVGQFDQIYVVHVPLDIQLQRLVARDKISTEIAQQRLKSQWPMEKKMSQAHALIDNSGSRDETRKQVGILARQLLR